MSRGGVGSFCGSHSLNLDEKGRIAVPKRVREELRGRGVSSVVITIDPADNCLLIYPSPEWVDVQEKINRLPTFNKTTRFLKRTLIGHASEVEMDRQGRVLLAAELRRHAGLETNGRAYLMGQGNNLELWNEESWLNRLEEDMGTISLEDLESAPELESLSI